MRILLANPNTTEAVTRLCAAAAREAAAPGTEIVPVTAAFGAAIIDSRAELALAGHAMLDLLAAHREGADAVLLAVSFDTALLGAREMLRIPVVGMTEAAMLTACLLGSRFALLTFGPVPLYRELVAAHGLSERLAGIGVVPVDARRAYGDPDAAAEAAAGAARRLQEDSGADVVVLCGAAMAGLARRIEDRVPVPVLDGIASGVPLCEMLVRRAPRRPRAGSLAGGGARATTGLSAPLAALLAEPGPRE